MARNVSPKTIRDLAKACKYSPIKNVYRVDLDKVLVPFIEETFPNFQAWDEDKAKEKLAELKSGTVKAQANAKANVEVNDEEDSAKAEDKVDEAPPKKETTKKASRTRRSSTAKEETKTAEKAPELAEKEVVEVKVEIEVVEEPEVNAPAKKTRKSRAKKPAVVPDEAKTSPKLSTSVKAEVPYNGKKRPTRRRASKKERAFEKAKEEASASFDTSALDEKIVILQDQIETQNDIIKSLNKTVSAMAQQQQDLVSMLIYVYNEEFAPEDPVSNLDEVDWEDGIREQCGNEIPF